MRTALLVLLVFVLVFIICISDSVAARRHKKRKSKWFRPSSKIKHLRHHKLGYTNSKYNKPKSHYKNTHKPINSKIHKHEKVHSLPSQHNQKLLTKPAKQIPQLHSLQTESNPASQYKIASTGFLRNGASAVCTQCPTEKTEFCGGPSQDLCDRSFDSYVLSLTWPSGFCKQILSKGTNGCKMPKNRSIDFSIHGLWPQSKRSCSSRIIDKNGQPQTKVIPLPQYCKSNAPFTLPATNSQLYKKLLQYWVSYNEVGANVDVNQGLWCHEWHAHGTCTDWDSQTYLEQTINLFESKFLRQQKSLISQLSVQPSNRPISKSSLINAFKTAFGVVPSLTCSMDKETRIEYLREVVFCFDKQFNLKDSDFCDQRSSCKREEILFPSL